MRHTQNLSVCTVQLQKKEKRKKKKEKKIQLFLNFIQQVLEVSWQNKI